MTQRVATRLKRPGWRNMVLPELARLGLSAFTSQRSVAPLPPPWPMSTAAPTVETEVTTSKNTASQSGAATKTIADRGPTDLQIFKDGSIVEGASNGGASLVVMAGEAITHRWHAATGATSIFFLAENTAME